jgi:uncharacterized protein (DUF362 family)
MEQKKCKYKEKKEHENLLSSRRGFIKTLSSVAASAVVLNTIGCAPGGNDNPNPDPGGNTDTVKGPRTGKNNPFVTADGKPILVSIDGIDFQQMLTAGLAAIGGLTQLIEPNEEVLINPNYNHVDPFPGVSSVHSVASIVEAVKQVTNGTVKVGDQGYTNSSAVYNGVGLIDPVNNAGGEVIHFTDIYKTRQSDWESDRPDFHVYRAAYDTPVLIDTCVLKRHHWASLTCAIKNCVGMVAGSGASATRDYLHYQASDFLRELAEIAGLIKPDLAIVDARSILTLNGPYLSDGVVKDAGKVVICGDLVATDTYCAGIMAAHDDRFDISSIQRTLEVAESLGLGTSDLSQVEIIEITI